MMFHSGGQVSLPDESCSKYGALPSPPFELSGSTQWDGFLATQNLSLSYLKLERMILTYLIAREGNLFGPSKAPCTLCQEKSVCVPANRQGERNECCAHPDIPGPSHFPAPGQLLRGTSKFLWLSKMVRHAAVQSNMQGLHTTLGGITR